MTLSLTAVGWIFHEIPIYNVLQDVSQMCQKFNVNHFSKNICIESCKLIFHGYKCITNLLRRLCIYCQNITRQDWYDWHWKLCIQQLTLIKRTSLAINTFKWKFFSHFRFTQKIKYLFSRSLLQWPLAKMSQHYFLTL